MSMNLVYKTRDVFQDFPVQTPTSVTYEILSIKTKDKQIDALKKYIIETFSSVWDEDTLNEVIEDIEICLSDKDTVLDMI